MVKNFNIVVIKNLGDKAQVFDMTSFTEYSTVLMFAKILTTVFPYTVYSIMKDLSCLEMIFILIVTIYCEL